MTRDLRLAVWAVAAACAMTACKSGDGGAGPELSYVGAWEGTTSQARQVQFYVEDDGVHLVALGFTIPGTSCTTNVAVFLSREAPDTSFQIDGADLAVNTSGSSGVLDFEGSFTSATAASGTLRVTSTACGGVIDLTWTASKASTPETGFTDTWTGNLQSSALSPTSGTIDIAQNGASLTGTFSMTNGATGTFTGAVSGNLGTFTITETTPGCAGSFAGHAVRRDEGLGAGPILFVGYSGSDCLGAHNRAGGFLTPAP